MTYMRKAGLAGLTFTGTVLVAGAAMAAPAPVLDSGVNAWMMVCTALVLMMTIPGVALFYGGMVRKKNVLSVLMQSFAITCLISLLWFVIGYSLSFSGTGPFVGDLSNLFLNKLTVAGLTGASGGKYSEATFMLFQMTFAIITPALIFGAVAERMKFSAAMLFVAAWSLVVYAPIAHMVWSESGFFFAMGALDFAGGTVVHINSGVAALVACIVIGKRVGFGVENMAPHNLVLSVIGAALLWVGWFGFNGGSAYAADGRAAMALVTTQVATATAALAWMAAEWISHKKPSLLGLVTGAVAGLVAITPGAGYVTPVGAFWIGLAGGAVCFFATTWVKRLFGYDDSLDVFGVHGVGGIVGAILTGVFATRVIMGGDASMGLLEGNGGQVVVQLSVVLATIIYSGVGSYIILKIIDRLVGLRVPGDSEREGLDIRLHGESVS
ncbi:ammonium transporter [Govanella unica]|uniref:Ammonium transporter n=1 Tax=Govanella unica TaxID=2975056 RepID=A0A9X3TYK2_9PROT|nr:ammonium transporter [Govania unica]MDA5194158.1 ammonium transporter [Govania unica]